MTLARLVTVMEQVEKRGEELWIVYTNEKGIKIGEKRISEEELSDLWIKERELSSNRSVSRKESGFRWFR